MTQKVLNRFFRYFVSDAHIVFLSIITIFGFVLSMYQIHYFHINKTDEGELQEIFKSSSGIGFWMVSSYIGLIIVHPIDLISLVCLRIANSK